MMHELIKELPLIGAERQCDDFASEICLENHGSLSF